MVGTANKIQHKILNSNTILAHLVFNLHGIFLVSGKFPHFSVKGDFAFHILNAFFQIGYFKFTEKTKG